jgi:hypothetical protein
MLIGKLKPPLKCTYIFLNSCVGPCFRKAAFERKIAGFFYIYTTFHPGFRTYARGFPGQLFSTSTAVNRSHFPKRWNLGPDSKSRSHVLLNWLDFVSLPGGMDATAGEAFSAGPPPPDTSRVPLVVGVTAPVFALAVIAYLMRMATRVINRLHLGWDDYSITVAVVYPHHELLTLIVHPLTCVDVNSCPIHHEHSGVYARRGPTLLLLARYQRSRHCTEAVFRWANTLDIVPHVC